MTYYLLTGPAAEQARTMLGRASRELAELLFEGSPPHRHTQSYTAVLDSETGVVVAASPGAPKPAVLGSRRIFQKRYLNLSEAVDAELWKRWRDRKRSTFVPPASDLPACTTDCDCLLWA